jgi:HSP20 family protein
MYNTKNAHNQFPVDAFARIFAPFVHAPLKEVINQQNKTWKQPILSNIHKTDQHFVISLAVPGFSKDEINITIEDRQLSISSTAVAIEENKALLREWKKEAFTKTFKLPKDANLSKIEAKCDAGVLTIHLGVVEKPQAHTISIL